MPAPPDRGHARSFESRRATGDQGLELHSVPWLDPEHGGRLGVVVAPRHGLERRLELMGLGVYVRLRWQSAVPGNEASTQVARIAERFVMRPLVSGCSRCGGRRWALKAMITLAAGRHMLFSWWEILTYEEWQDERFHFALSVTSAACPRFNTTLTGSVV